MIRYTFVSNGKRCIICKGFKGFKCFGALLDSEGSGICPKGIAVESI